MPLSELPSDELSFAVCTFQRVFDTYPAHDILTLEDLVFHLTHFELKPSVLRLIERDVERAGLALEAFKAGRHRGGWHYSQLTKAAKAAKAADPILANEEAAAASELAVVREAHDRLVKSARKRAKQELRIWAPNLYAAGAIKRGTDGVEQLSCLVLDYDEGRRMEQARIIWEPYFHIGHTTWSHSDETHKFRLIMPLACPVRAEDWAAFWTWAEEVSGPGVDPACKGVARAYALPVVPNLDWPRHSWVNRAPLLDPLSEGLIPVAATPRAAPIEADHPSWFREGAEEAQFAPFEPHWDSNRGPNLTVSAPLAGGGNNAGDEDAEWRLFDGPVDMDSPQTVSDGRERRVQLDQARVKSATAPSVLAHPSTSPVLQGDTARVLELLDRISTRLASVERTMSWLRGLPPDQVGLTAQLERLQTLYEDGALSQDEFQRAKALILEDA